MCLKKRLNLSAKQLVLRLEIGGRENPSLGSLLYQKAQRANQRKTRPSLLHQSRARKETNPTLPQGVRSH